MVVEKFDCCSYNHLSVYGHVQVMALIFYKALLLNGVFHHRGFFCYFGGIRQDLWLILCFEICHSTFLVDWGLG